MCICCTSIEIYLHCLFDLAFKGDKNGIAYMFACAQYNLRKPTVV